MKGKPEKEKDSCLTGGGRGVPSLVRVGEASWKSLCRISRDLNMVGEVKGKGKSKGKRSKRDREEKEKRD